MADTPQVIVVDPNAQAREQFNAERRALAANPLDRAQEPGGYYLNADGLGAHDANGNPVELRAKDRKAADDIRALAEARSAAAGSTDEDEDAPEELADKKAGAKRGKGK